MGRRKKKKSASGGKKLKKQIQKAVKKEVKKVAQLNLHPETKTSIIALVFICVAFLFVLSAFDKAGPAGKMLHSLFEYLLGVGYFAVPTLLFLSALFFFFSMRVRPRAVVVGGIILLLSALGITDIVEPGRGGLLGAVGGLTERPFGFSAALLINAFALLAGILVTFNVPLKLPRFSLQRDSTSEESADSDEVIQNAVMQQVAAAQEEQAAADVDDTADDDSGSSRIRASAACRRRCPRPGTGPEVGRG